MQDAHDGPRAPDRDQRSHHAVGRLGARLDLVSGESEHERDVGSTGELPRRQRGERQRRRVRRLGPCVAALPKRPDAKRRDDRCDEQRDAGGRAHHEQAAACAVGDRLDLGVLVELRRRQEVAFERAEISCSVCPPFAGGAQPHAAVQRARLAAERVPFAGGVGEAPVDQQARAICLDPAAKPRPVTDQRFVRDVDDVAALLVAAAGQQPPVDELRDHGLDARARELVARRAAAGVLRALSRLCETQQHTLCDLLLIRVERRIRALGALRERTAHTPRLTVRRERQRPAAAKLP